LGRQFALGLFDGQKQAAQVTLQEVGMQAVSSAADQ